MAQLSIPQIFSSCIHFLSVYTVSFHTVSLLALAIVHATISPSNSAHVLIALITFPPFSFNSSSNLILLVRLYSCFASLGNIDSQIKQTSNKRGERESPSNNPLFISKVAKFWPADSKSCLPSCHARSQLLSCFLSYCRMDLTIPMLSPQPMN